MTETLGVDTVLVVDDHKDARELVIDFMSQNGYKALGIATSKALVATLSELDPSVVLLDLQLDEDTSIGEVHLALRARFPEVAFPHDAVLVDLCHNDSDQISGRYLLPMIKAARPKAEVIILTGAWEGIEDEQYLRKWGAYVTVPKFAPDNAFVKGSNVMGLDRELLKYLREVTMRRRSEA